MTAIERARLKPGRRIKWEGRNFIYHGFANKAHALREDGVSVMRIAPLTGFVFVSPAYEYLSNDEICNATVEGPL